MNIMVDRSNRDRRRSRKEFEDQLLERAARDSEFRSELISNPRLALARELGIAVPEGVNVNVVVESATTFFIVLPPDDGAVALDATVTGVVRLLSDTIGPMY